MTAVTSALPRQATAEVDLHPPKIEQHDLRAMINTDPKGFRRGIEHSGKTGAAAVILLFAQSPGLIFYDVLIHCSDQCPSCLQSSRKLELIEQCPEFANCPTRDLGNGFFGRRNSRVERSVPGTSSTTSQP